MASVHDMIKSIRANKGREEEYIREAIVEIKDELKSSDIKAKARAIQKLLHLNTIGYEIEWAAFNIIEVMSQQKFNYKRLGYHAATQCFTPTTDVIMLTTELIRKDLKSGDEFTVGTALTGLANIATPDLARDLIFDVTSLLNSAKPYIRKKSTLILYKLFVQHPDSLRPTFDALKEKLKDSNASVVSCAMNVIVELARKNPQNYVNMAPLFFHLLTNLTNNWCLIKIVKLFGELTPHEKRLSKKLTEPLSNLINSSTQAKSLLYECLNTVTKGMRSNLVIVKLAVEKLKTFIDHPDQNLKYLGLLGLNNLMSTYPKIISELKDTIIKCLEDEDITIRKRSVDLLAGVVSKKNIRGIMKRLLKYTETAEGEYKNYLIERIIMTAAKDNYSSIASFKWYIQLLFDLSQMDGLKHGKLISDQLINVMVRVPSMRGYGLSKMIELLRSEGIQNYITKSDDGEVNSNVHEVLFAISYCVGEYYRDFKVQTKDQKDEADKEEAEEKKEGEESAEPKAEEPAEPKEEGEESAEPKAEETPAEPKEEGEETPAEPKPEETPAEPKEEEAEEEETEEDMNSPKNIVSSFFSLPAMDALPPNVQSAIIQCVVKLYAYEAKQHAESVKAGNNKKVESHKKMLAEIFSLAEDHFDVFLTSPNLETMERSVSNFELMKLHQDMIAKGENEVAFGLELAAVFEEPLKPIASNANRLIPVPEGLNLDKWIGKPFKVDLKKLGDQFTWDAKKTEEELYAEWAQPAEVTQADGEKPQVVNTYQQSKNIYLLQKAEVSSVPSPKNLSSIIPESEISKKLKGASPAKEDDKKKKKKKHDSDDDDDDDENVEILKEEVMPTNAIKSKEAKIDPLSKIQITGPLTENEKLKAPKAYPNMVEQRKLKEKETQQAAMEAAKKIEEKKPEEEGEKKKKKKSKKIKEEEEPKKKIAGTKKKICADNYMKVTYTTSATPGDPSHIGLPFTFENLTGAYNINSIQVQIEDGLGIRMIRPAEQNQHAPLEVPFVLAPGEKKPQTVQFYFAKDVKPHTVTGTIKYNVTAQGGKNIEKPNLPFTLIFACSLFMSPKKMNEDELKDMMEKNKLPYPAATKIQFPGKKNADIVDIDDAVAFIGANLRLTTVSKQIGVAAQLYGESVQGNKVAVLVKIIKQGEASVEIKSTNDTLGSSLAKEIAKLFH